MRKNTVIHLLLLSGIYAAVLAVGKKREDYLRKIDELQTERTSDKIRYESTIRKYQIALERQKEVTRILKARLSEREASAENTDEAAGKVLDLIMASPKGIPAGEIFRKFLPSPVTGYGMSSAEKRKALAYLLHNGMIAKGKNEEGRTMYSVPETEEEK